MRRLFALSFLLLCVVLLPGDVAAAPQTFFAVGPVDPGVAARATLRRPRARRLRRMRTAVTSSVSSSASSMDQSSSPPALTVRSAGASSQSSVLETQRHYVAFLNRYLTIPVDWKVTIDAEKRIVTFEKENAEQGKDKHVFTVALIDIHDCDVTAIQKNFRRRQGEDKTPPAVSNVRIPGILPSSYKWKDDTTPGGALQYCVLPPQLVRASHVRTSDTDTVSIKFIESTLLRQLAWEERGRSR